MFYVLAALLVILYFGKKGNLPKTDDRICFIICLMFVFMAAFRSNLVGGDTAAYRSDYESLVQYHSLADLVDRYGESYIGYFGLSKLFSICGMPVQVWFAFLEGVYLFSLMKLINKYSSDKVFSLIVFATCGLFVFSLAGLKQTLAASMLMIAFVAFTDKQYWKMILLMAASYFTHPAAMVFCGVFPLYLFRNSKAFVPIVIIILVIAYTYSITFLESIVTLLDSEHFESYLVEDNTYSLATFIFYIFITLVPGFLLLFGKNKRRGEENGSDVNTQFFWGLSLFASVLQLLAEYSPTLFRLSLLYVPFMMVLLPNSVENSARSVKAIYKLFMIAVLVFFFLYSNKNFPYSFQW